MGRSAGNKQPLELEPCMVVVPWTGSSSPVVTEAATQTTCAKAATGLCWANHPTHPLLSDYENHVEKSRRVILASHPCHVPEGSSCTGDCDSVGVSPSMPVKKSEAKESGRVAQAYIRQVQRLPDVESWMLRTCHQRG